VSDVEPFNDAAFVSRLQKLLPMLGSTQPGEAEAARRKLLEHLANHRLSLTDLSQRLAGGAARASFTQGAREMSLERQLSIARAARQEAEGEARIALQQVMELQQSLQAAAFDVGRALQAQSRARLVASAGWLAAALAATAAFIFHARLDAADLERPGAAPQPGVVVRRNEPEAGADALRLSPGERFGTVLVQDLAVRLTPSDDAGVRAFLNLGMRVVIEQQARVGSRTWLLIRSVTGTGWVRSGDILH
jgi:hypothetical protein